MNIVTNGLADLRPVRLVIQVAFFAHPPIQFCMRRDILDIGRCPMPNNPNSILNILLVTDVTFNFIVRALFPSLPRGIHQMA